MRFTLARVDLLAPSMATLSSPGSELENGLAHGVGISFIILNAPIFIVINRKPFKTSCMNLVIGLICV
jgi:hypothetical protein